MKNTNYKVITFMVLLLCLFVYINHNLHSQSSRRTGSVYYEDGIVHFEDDRQFTIAMRIPNTLRILNGNSPVQGAYNLNLLPTSNTKASIQITILKNQTGEMMSKQQFETNVKNEASRMLSQAVEEYVTYTDVVLNEGYGIYYTLTDASLINKIPASDEYLYLTSYRANYNNGYIVIGTILIDDLNNTVYQHMLESLLSMVILYSN